MWWISFEERQEKRGRHCAADRTKPKAACHKEHKNVSASPTKVPRTPIGDVSAMCAAESFVFFVAIPS
jgi:hypothetical protein